MAWWNVKAFCNVTLCALITYVSQSDSKSSSRNVLARWSLAVDIWVVNFLLSVCCSGLLMVLISCSSDWVPIIVLAGYRRCRGISCSLLDFVILLNRVQSILLMDCCVPAVCLMPTYTAWKDPVVHLRQPLAYIFSLFKVTLRIFWFLLKPNDVHLYPVQCCQTTFLRIIRILLVVWEFTFSYAFSPAD